MRIQTQLSLVAVEAVFRHNLGEAMTYIYEDTKTRELYHYSRKGIYKKNGRPLRFVKKTRGDTTTIDFIKEADEFLQKKNSADEKAGYPPNCNKGYVEKDGKCVPSE